jgi:DNA polymerase IIIc chi subunit
MDLNSSIGQTESQAKEESVEELIKKLQQRGTKVVIQKEDEELTNTMTPKQNSSKKKEIANKENS